MNIRLEREGEGSGIAQELKKTIPIERRWHLNELTEMAVTKVVESLFQYVATCKENDVPFAKVQTRALKNVLVAHAVPERHRLRSYKLWNLMLVAMRYATPIEGVQTRLS